MFSISGKFAFAILSLSVPAALAQQIAIGHYVLPTNGSFPYGITMGPDGALWFAEETGNKIGRITAAGAITEYQMPTPNSAPCIITVGPDGALWFTEFGGNRIGRITTAGVITEYPVPTRNSYPFGITTGPDGALWFTESMGSKIGRITTAGVITEYPLPSGLPSEPGALGEIKAGPDGAMWFSAVTEVFRFTTTGSSKVYALPGGIGAIGVGPDSALWLSNNCAIDRITPSGAITGYPLGNCNGISGFTAEKDGVMWFANGDAVGRITTAGTTTLYPVSDPVGTGQIAVGPGGELWFAEPGGSPQPPSAIGEAFFVTASLTASPDTGFYRTDHTFTGGGFAPNETIRIYERGVGSAVLATATADASGTFNVSARQPQAPFGPRVYVGVGESSHKLGAASFTVTPNLILDPDFGPMGSIVTVSGYGFAPFEPVKISWGEKGILLGTAAPNVDGTFDGSAALTFTVPAGASTGAVRVQGTWDCLSRSNCPDAGYGAFTVE